MRSLYQHVQPQTVVCRKQFVLLLIAVGDATAVEVIDGKFDLNLVAGKNLDVVHTHLPRDMSKNLVAVFKLYAKHCVRQCFENGTF